MENNFSSSAEMEYSGVAEGEELKLNDGLDTGNTIGTEDQNVDDMNTDAVEFSASEVEKLVQSANVGCHSENANRLARMLLDQVDVDETGLMDVQVTVDSTCGEEDVPFVGLASVFNGVPIIGYPIEVEKICDTSESMETGDHKFLDGEGSKVQPLVWRRSKRTPVCYVTNSLASASRDSKAGKSSNNAGNLIPLPRENGVLVKEGSFDKLLKNPCEFKRGRAASRATCVPVERIFSNLMAAIGGV